MLHISENIHKHQPCKIPDYVIELHVYERPVYICSRKSDLG